MVSVYDACAEIDRCGSPVLRAKLIRELRKRVWESNRAWAEGVKDFLDFETYRLTHGVAPVDVLEDSDAFRALAALDGAYQHGAFQGLCQTPGGAAWIGRLGELCAAMVHQGFKWVRGSDHGVDEWELPALGEAWCKGAVLWGLAGFFGALDTAGGDPDNDAVLSRSFSVIAAHHVAGAVWKEYRGKEHPHKAWSADVRGCAPSPAAVRTYGAKFRWPPEMIDVLARAAEHVNTWVNPSYGAEFEDRTRGFLIGANTPRLLAKTRELAAELGDAAGDLTPTEREELVFRTSNWMCPFANYWRGRDSNDDRLLEISALGALAGVMRDSRPHLTQHHVSRVVEWARPRMEHLSQETQGRLLDRVRRTVEVRGRVPGAFSGLGSEGCGPVRYLDGVWSLTADTILLTECSTGGGDLNPVQAKWATLFFNSLTKNRRKPGRDFHGKEDAGALECIVCAGDAMIRSLIDNRPNLCVMNNFAWGALGYANLGLGEVGDESLGTR
ncbi:hypothetical protein AB0I84_36955 [Streptomyces spectabilis]|uniref:hypothetical protein n=1 Tax=Streptomyces spectabilis TaxID=68270 RepID=UPI0033D1A50F